MINGIWITDEETTWELSRPKEFYIWSTSEEDRYPVIYRANHHYTLGVF